MNTPAHIIFNGLALGRGRWRLHWFAITAGALMPDLPMVGFYLYQRGFLTHPEHLIWSEKYFAPHWQTFFDAFNSLPIIAIGALAAWRARSRPWLAFFFSMGLHCLTDLPLHREDAHAHFFPLSSWRFSSPVSYWDPRHHGPLFLLAEGLLVAGGALALTRSSRSRPWRMVGAVTLALYLALGAFALSVWS
jgi:hypothetical protein